jgi:hypothetical protein
MSAEEYRRYAAECLKISKSVEGRETKSTLLHMASLGRTWPTKQRSPGGNVPFDDAGLKAPAAVTASSNDRAISRHRPLSRRSSD